MYVSANQKAVSLNVHRYTAGEVRAVYRHCRSAVAAPSTGRAVTPGV
jgi:hypothetical protein